MTALPEKVQEAWKNHEGPIVLTTVDANGKPNSIYATCISLFSPEKIIVADNYFGKTRDNCKNGCSASVLFITPAGDAYQVKGKVEYHTSGEYYDNMKCWNPAKHPGHAAAVVHVEEVYSGSDKLA